jgi:hypothetical protein
VARRALLGGVQAQQLEPGAVSRTFGVQNFHKCR